MRTLRRLCAGAGLLVCCSTKRASCRLLFSLMRRVAPQLPRFFVAVWLGFLCWSTAHELCPIPAQAKQPVAQIVYPDGQRNHFSSKRICRHLQQEVILV